MRKREKEKEKGEGKKRKRGDASAPTAAIGRAWRTGGRATRDGTPARKERENYGQRKKERQWKLDVRTAEQNLGRGLNELNDEINLEINKLARDLNFNGFLRCHSGRS